ncbi:MAG: hypothetical protein V1773_07085 [bacterium]
MLDILKIIDERALRKRRKIGIGILSQNLHLASNYFKIALKYADVIPVPTYEKLLELLYNKEIEGIVRGQLDSPYQLFNELSTKYNFRKDYRVSIIKDVCGRIFFFGPTSARWNHCVDDKIEYIERVVRHIKDFGIEEKEIKIAIILPMHQNDIVDLENLKNLDRDSIVQLRFLQKALIDSDNLIKKLHRKGLLVKNYDNRIEFALKDKATFIVPYNGIFGNAISRALWLIDQREGDEKAKLISLQLLTEKYYEWVIENTSPSEDDFSSHIISSVAWLNRKIN